MLDRLVGERSQRHEVACAMGDCVEALQVLANELVQGIVFGSGRGRQVEGNERGLGTARIGNGVGGGLELGQRAPQGPVSLLVRPDERRAIAARGGRVVGDQPWGEWRRIVLDLG